MECPFCAETVDDDAVDCPSCGEALDEDLGTPSKGGGGATVAIVLVLVVFGGICLIGILATLLMPALMKAKGKANKTKCSNNLRMLGLASLQYADDKRFFPHVGPLDQLDGDIQSPDSPKIARSLLWYGYHDNPESWICPESFDMWIPVTDPAVNANMRQWFWDGGAGGSATTSPFVDGLSDPNLADTYELSYGWTRRGLNTNVRSTTVVAADRAVREQPESTHPVLIGNHDDGWNVLSADCSVMFNSVNTGQNEGQRLVGTNAQEAALSIKPQTDPTVFR